MNYRNPIALGPCATGATAGMMTGNNQSVKSISNIATIGAGASAA